MMIKTVARIGYVVVVLLALFGLLSVATRFIGVMQLLTTGEAPSPPPDFPIAEEFDGRYYRSPYLTLVHILTGMLFMVLGPIQFWPAVRNRWIGFHRWSGRIWMVAALAGGISALLFVWRLPVFGSFSTSVGVVVGDVLFLASLAQGYRAIRRREIARHREWMIRAFALGLAISTFRVLIPLLMMPPLNATFPEAWDTVVWLAFTINAVTAEIWINVTRKRPLNVPTAGSKTRDAAHRPAMLHQA